jgi:RNA polymerase sigma-70 factor (ECF subfamily)
MRKTGGRTDANRTMSSVAIPPVRHDGAASFVAVDVAATDTTRLDAESRAWLTALRGNGPDRDAAVARLHALLLRAAHFEVRRRHATTPHLRGGDLDDLAVQSADDALLAVLAKLDDFRGESRFTTWAYKFALLETSVTMRRRAWQQREVPLEQDAWELISARRASPGARARTSELFAALALAINECLSDQQRDVLVAITLNGVPIDVLAERRGTTRGALYKTLHDARRRLRAELAEQGLEPTLDHEEDR